MFVISLKGKGMFSNNKEQLADWVKSELKKYLSDEGATSDGTPTFGAYLKLCVSFLHVLQVWEDLFDLTCISISMNSILGPGPAGIIEILVKDSRVKISFLKPSLRSGFEYEIFARESFN